jgi:hypothetical protein
MAAWLSARSDILDFRRHDNLQPTSVRFGLFARFDRRPDTSGAP